MSETIYGDIKPIEPIYVVETDNGICHVTATECLIDPEWKVVCFCIGDSVQAMFRLENIKTFGGLSDD